MGRLLAKVVMAFMWLPLLALVLGLGGTIHPAADSLAVFRQPLGLLVLAFAVLLLLLGARWRGFSSLAIAGVALMTTLPPASPAPSGGQVVRVYQKNLMALLTGPKRLIEDIRASGADIVTLQEVNDRNMAVVEALSDLYPYQAICPFIATGGQAVLSKFPAVGPEIPCESKRGLAGMLVDTGRHRIWAVSMHLHWPWPYGQPDQVQWIESFLSTLDEPIVLGGDFNMVPWSATVQNIALAGSMERAGQAGQSFTLPDIRLSIPIDHVLMPAGSNAAHSELRPQFGSDHKGVFTRFELP